MLVSPFAGAGCACDLQQYFVGTAWSGTLTLGSSFTFDDVRHAGETITIDVGSDGTLSISSTYLFASETNWFQFRCTPSATGLVAARVSNCASGYGSVYWYDVTGEVHMSSPVGGFFQPNPLALGPPNSSTLRYVAYIELPGAGTTQVLQTMFEVDDGTTPPPSTFWTDNIGCVET